MRDIADHNPWRDAEETEIHEFSNGGEMTHRHYRSPDGRFTFTSTTYTSGGRSPRTRSPHGGGVPEEPLLSVLQSFNTIYQGLMDPSNLGRRDTRQAGGDSGWGSESRGRGDDPFTAFEGLWPRDANHPQPMAHPLASINEYEPPLPPSLRPHFHLLRDILSRLPRLAPAVRSGDHARPPHLHIGHDAFSDLDNRGTFGSFENSILELLRTDFGPETMGAGPGRRGGVRVMTGQSPFSSLLASLLNMDRHGDAVYSQEELDRVISQLIDQNTNGSGPPPASQSAIRSLPRKKVDKEMLGSEGKAECSICMDSVQLGTEVAVLPCKHWFHFNCIEMWLNQHNTCPHCRRSIGTPGQ